MVRRYVLCLLAAASSAFAAEPTEYEVRFRCADDSSSFAVGDIANTPWLEQSEEIVFPEVPRLKKTGRWGSLLRAESRKTVTRKCGVFTLVFQSGFLNDDPDGELGVVELGAVQVLRGSAVVLPRTAFGACDVRIGRYEVLGPCPARYARRIVGRRNERGQVSFEIIHQFWGDDSSLHMEESRVAVGASP